MSHRLVFVRCRLTFMSHRLVFVTHRVMFMSHRIVFVMRRVQSVLNFATHPILSCKSTGMFRTNMDMIGTESICQKILSFLF